MERKDICKPVYQYHLRFSSPKQKSWEREIIVHPEVKFSGSKVTCITWVQIETKNQKENKYKSANV